MPAKIEAILLSDPNTSLRAAAEISKFAEADLDRVCVS